MTWRFLSATLSVLEGLVIGGGGGVGYLVESRVCMHALRTPPVLRITPILPG
jgi:hypothetical protein